MKTRVIILSVGLGLTVLVSLARFLPWLAPYFASQDPKTLFGIQTTMLGIQFTLLSATIGFLFLKAEADAERFRTDVKGAVGGAHSKFLRDDEFYRIFLDAARTAKSFVRICYFSPTPPPKDSNADRVKYYRELAGIIRKTPNVIYKRLIRESRANLEWARELARDLKGASNFDLAIVKDVDEQRLMPLALSVQVVDEEQVWFVAIQAHDREGPHRDLYVRSPQVARGMSDYFERLWQMGTLLVRRGAPTEDGKKLLGE